MTQSAGERAALIALCVGAVIVRVATTYLLPNVAHPDETFQYLEQAYRLSTGRGLVPWEYAVGARSWILAGLVAPAMKVGLLASSAPAVHLWSVTLFMIALSVAHVVAAFVLARRVGTLSHACLAGLLASVWCEFVYLSPHVLADTVSAVPLVAAFALGYGVEAAGPRRMAWTGVLLGLALVVRVQLAPAIAVAMLGLGGRNVWSRHVPMALGLCGPLLLSGLTDWLTYGAPFGSVLVYVRVNAGGMADVFGTAPLSSYVRDELVIWGVAAPLVLLTAGFGARKMPLVGLVTGVILVTLSLIAHKEYRFVYPALALLFVLCGVGSADLIERLAAMRVRGGAAPRPIAIPAAVGALWLLASVASGAQAPLRQLWQRHAGWLASFEVINADPAACGVGIDPPAAWSFTGLVRLRADVALYEGGAPAEASSAAYNYLLVQEPVAQEPVAKEPGSDKPREIGAFRQIACAGLAQRVCMLKRSGGCDTSGGRPLRADPGPDVRRVLRRLGLAER